MSKIKIKASVSGLYRRAGLDLSNGQTIIVDQDDLSKDQLEILDGDPRITVKFIKPEAKKSSTKKAKSGAVAPKTAATSGGG